MKIKALLWAIIFIGISGGIAYAQNNAPVIEPVSPQFVNEGDHLELVITASDIDGDSLVITIEDMPANASFGDSSNGHGLLVFDPDYTQSGEYQIKVIAADSAAADTELVSITVNDVNRAPVIDPVTAQIVNEGAHLEFVVTSSDPDSDGLTLIAEDLPLNAAFTDSGNGHGLFAFDPDYTQNGTYNVRFIARDSEYADTTIASITVNRVNVAPELTTIGSRSIAEGGHLEINVTASDMNDDTIELKAENLVSNSSFTDNGGGQGSFTFDPDSSQSGIVNITFIATDGELADTEVVEITVSDVNVAPVLDAIAPQVIDEGSHLEYVITASDFDGDVLTLSMYDNPLNAAFVDSGNGHGLFTFDPDYTQEGLYAVKFIASDDDLADTVEMAITVNHYNTAPVLNPIGAQFVAEGGHLEINISASDLNDDTIELKAENLVSNSSFTDNGGGQGSFTFDPDSSQSGIVNITFIATDGELADTEVVEITVSDVNLAPVFEAITPQVIDENSHFEYLVTASDFDGNSLTINYSDNPTNSSFEDYGNGTGLFVFDPSYLQAGSYNVRFIVDDGELADTVLMAITVNDVNAPPVITPVSAQLVNEGETLNLVIESSDIDGTVPSLTAELLPVNANFTDSANGNGLLTFIPDFTQSGNYSVRIIASDGTDADTELVDVTVNQVNVAPVLDAIAPQAVDEGSHLEYVIIASDFDGDVLTLSMYDNPLNAAFIDSGNGHGLFTFDPDYTQEGLYAIKFIASDNDLADTVEMAITVNHYNTAPVLNPVEAQFVAEGGHLEINISASDMNDDTIELKAENLVSNSSFTDNGGGQGSFTFDPDSSQSGIVNITFIATDGELADTEVVEITVSDVNVAPVLDAIAPQVIDEGSHLEYVITASDFDGDVLTLSMYDNPLNAAFVDSGNGHGLFTFDPDYTQEGLYAVKFIASDNNLADTVEMAITVNHYNTAPVLNPVGAQFVAEGATLSLHITSDDNENDALTYTILNSPTNAAFIDSGNGNASFVFNPDYTQEGNYSVTFKVDDGEYADSEIVQIEVTNINQAPILNLIGDLSIDEHQQLSYVVTAEDMDLQPLTLTALNLPLNSSFIDSGNGHGLFRFSPDYTQEGVYSVRFIVSDSELADSELVQVTVNNVNISPAITNIGDTTLAEGGHLEIDVMAVDWDGDPLVISAENYPTNSTFVDSGNGHAVYWFDPDYSQEGIYNIRFIAFDGGLADTEMVAITVTGVNQPPVIAPIDDRELNEGGYLSFVVTSSDPDGQQPQLSIFDNPENSVFEDSGNGTGLFVFQPDYLQAGEYDVAFVASDGEFSDTDYVHIIVNNVNLAPELASIVPQMVEEGGHLEFVVTSSDFDNDLLFLTAEDMPTNAAFIDSGNGHGLFTFDPSFEQEGVYYVRFIVSDNSLADSQLVSISVGGTNLPPVGEPINAQVVNEKSNLNFTVTFNDPDGQLLVLSAFDLPANSSFDDNLDGTGVFDFNPDSSQASVYAVGFIGFDGILADTIYADITVNDVNVAPVLEPITSPQDVVEGATLTFGVLAGDYDGNVLTLATSTLPTNAAFVDSGNGHGSFAFAPDFSQSGSYPIWFIAADSSLADSQLVTINVIEENLPPVLDDIPEQYVDEGQLLQLIVTATDPDGQPLTLWATTLPANASFDDSGNGHGLFTFAPDYSQSSQHVASFAVTDGLINDTVDVTINVNHVNLAPELEPINPDSVYEGDSFSLVVISSDFDDDDITLTAIDLPANAAFNDSGNGHGLFTFDPDYSQSGVYTASFIASDGEYADTEEVQITVLEYNRPPVWSTIPNYTVQEGGILAFNVAATDPDLTIPSLSVPNLPTNATFVDSLNGHGRFRFTPDYSQADVYQVMFLASDGELVDTVTVQITVNESGNQRPIIVSLDPQSVVEGQHLDLVISASDPEGSIPLLSAYNIPGNSVFADSGNGHGLFAFDPDYFQAGVYNVSFVAFDGQLADTETVEITVVDYGFRPELETIGEQTLTEGETLALTISASDPDMVPPILYAYGLPENSEFADSGDGTGSFVFMPGYTQAGAYQVLFVASDGALADSEYVDITVLEFGNNRPEFDPISDQMVSEGNELSFAISASDLDGTTPTLSTLDLPDNAEFTDNGNGTGQFDFTPSYYQAGSYNVTFIADDGSLADSVTIAVQVSDANGPPELAFIEAQNVIEGDSLGFELSSTDPDDDIILYSAINIPENAYIVDNHDGTGIFNFLPGFDQQGIYDITIIADDGFRSDSQIVVITVNEAGNQPPVINPLNPLYSVYEGDSLGVIISASDPDGDNIHFTFTALPFNAGYQAFSADSVLLYFKPSFTQNGLHNIDFTVDDGEFYLYDTLHIEVIEAGSMPPVFDPVEPQTVDEGAELVINLTADDPDNTAPPAITVNNPHEHSTFNDNGDGTAVYTYNPDYFDSGLDTLVFIAVDSDNLQGILRVEVTTTEHNLAPNLAYEGDSVAVQGRAMVATLIATDSTDSDGGPLYLSALRLPENATFVDNGNSTGSFSFIPDYDQVGQDSAIFLVADDGTPSLSTRLTVHIEIREQNRRPVWNAPLGSHEIDQAEMLNIPLSATDPDGDTLILRFAASPVPPRNASIVDNGDGTGQLIFTPDYTQAGIFIINVEAYDLIARTAANAYVFVNDLGNQFPTLNHIDDMSLVEGELLEVLITATDPDSTYPEIILENAPPRLEFTDNEDGTANLYFEPIYNQSGTYNLLFIARDPDGAADSQYVTLEIIEYGNHTPYVSSITDRQVNEGDAVSFVFYGSDADSTTPSLDALDLPANASVIDSGNGAALFQFNPDYTQAGTYLIRFRAVDAEDTTVFGFRDVTIEVVNVNRPPAFEEISSRTITEGDSLGFIVSATDPDGHIPILRLVTVVPNAVFFDSANGRGLFSFKPDLTQQGIYTFVFRAIDGQDTTVSSQTIGVVMVNDYNWRPELAPMNDTTIFDGQVLMLSASATDQNGTFPRLYASNMPPGATFTDNNDGTGFMRFASTYGDTGTYNDILFRAVDRQTQNLADSQYVSVRVILAEQHAPRFEPIQSYYLARPDEQFSIALIAQDYDGDQLEITVTTSVPLGAIFNDAGDGTASFTWTPQITQSDSTYLIGFSVTDETGLEDTMSTSIEVRYWVRGDANGDGQVIGNDVTYLVNYFRGNLPRPYPEGRGDANADGSITGSDVTFLVNYFRGVGPQPPPSTVSDNQKDALIIINKINQ